MALFDFLKRKKQIEKAKEKPAKKPAPAKSSGEAKPEKKTEKISAIKKEEPAVKPPVSKTRATKKFFYEAVNQPHISEKASYLSEKSNQYIFEVSPNYNKKEIKNAIQGIYGVDVLSVNVVKIPSKKRRLGKTEGFRKKYKKAIVKIREGQKIEIL